MKGIVCFEVNDWHRYPKFFDEWFDFGSGRHEAENWMKDLDAYAKRNRLCIKVVCVDMAVSLVVTAPKSWVKENIPEFDDERWVGYCVYRYPWPWINDYVKHQIDGIDPIEDEKYERRRKSDLEDLYMQFTEEERESFLPHNTYGSPSGETFLDWEQKNFGAREYVDGKEYKEQ